MLIFTRDSFQYKFKFRPFVVILFQSYNIEQVYNLLVTHEPFTNNLDRKKEVPGNTNKSSTLKKKC